MLARQAEAPVILDTPFRGERDYIHSTDLVAALDGLGGRFSRQMYLKNIELRRPAHRQVEAHFEQRPDAFGSFALDDGKQIARGWLVESCSPIARRIPFDESAIAQAAINEPMRVSLSAPVAGYSGFEQMIVLFKLLCAQSRTGKWVFTAMTLTRPLEAEEPMILHQSQKVLGRLIVAELHQADCLVGRMQMVLSQTMGVVS